jgi:hypothetical protein
MIYCEDCRAGKQLRRPATYPYCSQESNECELCHQRKVCYDYPALFAKQGLETQEEILLDKVMQNEYRMKCEGLIVAYVRGQFAGGTNHDKTEELKKVFVHRNTLKGQEVDWYATWELRKSIQKGYEIAIRNKVL